MPVIPLRLEHFYAIEFRESELERINADPKSFRDIAKLVQFDGGTLFIDGVIIGIFGFLEIWPGVYEVWAYPSIHVEKHSMVYLRTVKRYIQRIGETFNPRRLQTASFDDELHTRWMQFLGFECETPNGMRQYSVLGHTFNLWSKTYGGT